MRVIGRPVVRLDALDKVTGAAKYVGDMKFPGVLHAAILRSDCSHGRIKRIDIKDALALPGVHAVVTGEKYPKPTGLYLKDRTLFAVDKVRYYGEPVAGVVAETPELAKEAARLIRVEYEQLPPVYDPLSALADDAPLLHENLGDYEWAPVFFPKPGTNISNHFKLRKGDVKKGFAESHIIHEETYCVPHIYHSPLETHVAVGYADSGGRLTVWSSCQSPFAVRKFLSTALDIPLSKIRVITSYVGGGFGGKAGATIEGLVAPLALAVPGRHVKLVYSREEDFVGAYVRQGLIARLKTGVGNDGRIRAQQCELFWDAGAYTEYGANIVRAAGYTSAGPYDIPNLWTDSYCVYTNHPSGGPMRGFGMPELHWALELQMDTLADKLGMDPVEFRLLNCLKDGGVTATGEVVYGVGLTECIKTVAERIGWGEKKEGVEKGIAIMCKAPAMPTNASSSACLKFNEDGSVTLMTSAAEIGQGAMTALAQIAAEELSLPIEAVSVSCPDTAITPYEWQTVASRITFSAGNAVVLAAQDAKRQIFQNASYILGDHEMELVDGQVRVKGRPDLSVPLESVVMGAFLPDGSAKGGPVFGRGTFTPEGLINLDPETGQSPRPVAFWTFGAQGAEVSADPETGKITVHRLVAAFDVGRVINPVTLEGQVEGGLVQGLGSALFEEMVFGEDGQVLNNSFVDYKIPTSMDVPAIETYFVEVAQQDGPWGARGVGELPMVPTAPAIACALKRATGTLHRKLPLVRHGRD